MTEKQILKYYRSEIKGLTKQLKMLAQLKIKLDYALDGYRYGHNEWGVVQKQLDKIDDEFDCNDLVNNLR